ncbi:MAG: hypothetical protein GXP63_00795 [DPANN group archaeon]|nr:hypothetical protein [DPANN group archaeon]
MTPTTDGEYVRLYAERLRNDSSLFRQQKEFLESQYAASRSIFRDRFGDDEKIFRKKARQYLKKRALL